MFICDYVFWFLLFFLDLVCGALAILQLTCMSAFWGQGNPKLPVHVWYWNPGAVGYRCVTAKDTTLAKDLRQTVYCRYPSVC